MADDAPVLTPEERLARRREIAKRNGLVPCKPGETRNPKGINGRSRAAGLIRWLEEPSDTDEKKTRAEVVWQKLYLATLKGSVAAGKVLLEQCGRPPPSTAEQSMQLAEHFRKVALDSVDIGLRMLGAKLQTMDAKQLAEFWRECEANPSRFVDAARAAMDKASGDAPQDNGRERGSLNAVQGNRPSLESQGTPDDLGAISASPPAEGTEAQPSTPNVLPTEAGIFTEKP